MLQRGTSHFPVQPSTMIHISQYVWMVDVYPTHLKMSRRGEHLIFCLFPEFRHLSIIQISFCRTKTCNQNAVTALLYVSHMKCQQRQLSPASLSEDTQREGGGGGVGDITKYILHNSLAMKVLAAFS